MRDKIWTLLIGLLICSGSTVMSQEQRRATVQDQDYEKVWATPGRVSDYVEEERVCKYCGEKYTARVRKLVEKKEGEPELFVYSQVWTASSEITPHSELSFYTARGEYRICAELMLDAVMSCTGNKGEFIPTKERGVEVDVGKRFMPSAPLEWVKER